MLRFRSRTSSSTAARLATMATAPSVRLLTILLAAAIPDSV